MKFTLKTRVLNLDEPAVMGVLNVTPDSFSDGGRFCSVESALRQAEKMLAEGAAIVDIGGESTRPGAKQVSLAEELERVCPVVEAIKSRVDVAVSVDTSQARVAEETLLLGADLINDVRALTGEGMIEVVVKHDVPVCLMHMKGQPDSMQINPEYTDVIQEVLGFLKSRIAAVTSAGLSEKRVMIDPGFGFGKQLHGNLELLSRLETFSTLGFPVLAGLSRKSMIGQLTGRAVSERLAGSIALATAAVMKGALIVRAHDVSQTVDAVKIAWALRKMDKNQYE